ncbi:hypothetical protein N7G274_006368 [Stereocaulon virgatum]|uniref:Uncharacterized protein n=1 Tax=Stereocaulon virgatum TaxID=373712 RepID=A0ABR4A515_9LECA
MAPSAAGDDAASQALMARLIAEEWDSNQDSRPVGGSVEDYEDHLNSCDRGLMEDPDNVNNGPGGLATWGDPLVTDPNKGSPSTDTSHDEATSEGWDASVADGFDIGTPDTCTSEHGDQGGPHVLQGPGRIGSHHLSDELYERLGTERLALAQTVSLPNFVRRQSVERPRRISDLESITTSSASPPTEPDSPPRTEYIGYIMPAGTRVPSRPATPVDSKRKRSDPPRLETPSSQTSNPPSPTPRPTHMVYYSDDSNPPSPNSRSVHMVYIPDEPSFLEKSKTEQPVEELKKDVPDVEAKVANSNGKDKMRAFDEFDEHEGDRDDYNEGCEALRKEYLKKGSDLEGDEDENFSSPWIYIPYLGRCGEGFGEMDARTGDDEVVEIRLDDDDDPCESILSDIANTKSPDRINSTSLSGTQISEVQGIFDQDSGFKRVEAPKKMRARKKAWARYNQGLPQLPGDQELMDDESEDARHEVSKEMLKLRQDKVEKDVGVSEGKPGEVHKSQGSRARSRARWRWARGWPLRPGDKILLDAKSQEWKRTWGFNKELVQEGVPRQMPVKMGKVNSFDKLLRQVGDDKDDKDKVKGEHDDALEEKTEQRDKQPNDDEDVSRGRSSTREEHTAVHKPVDTEDETSKSCPRGNPAVDVNIAS